MNQGDWLAVAAGWVVSGRIGIDKDNDARVEERQYLTVTPVCQNAIVPGVRPCVGRDDVAGPQAGYRWDMVVRPGA